MRISLKNKDSESVSGFYKYDFGQVLEIEGLELPEQFEVHFQNGTGTPVTVNGTYNSESGIATVPIPDECFQQEALVFDAWLWVEDERSGKTLKTITFYLIDRECPEGVPPISSVNEIKSYADFVRENAQKVAEAEQAANDVEEFLNTADSKISEATNSKLDKQQGIENAGRILKVGADGYIGFGDIKNHLKTKVLYSYEEFEAFMDELYESFLEYAPVWLIFGFNDENNGISLGTGFLIFDDGSGIFDNALLIPMSASEIPFTEEIRDEITAAKRTRLYPLKAVANLSNQYLTVFNYDDTIQTEIKNISNNTKQVKLIIFPRSTCTNVYIGHGAASTMYYDIIVDLTNKKSATVDVYFIVNKNGFVKQIIYDCGEDSRVIFPTKNTYVESLYLTANGAEINFTVSAFGEG